MEQFLIKPIIPIEVGGVDISFTNSALFMSLAVLVSFVLFALCLRKRTLVPGVAQSVPEGVYEFVNNLLKENVGVEGLKYFPFIFTVFLFVAMGNVLGLLPYSFTFTSHLTAVGSSKLRNIQTGIGFVGTKFAKNQTAFCVALNGNVFTPPLQLHSAGHGTARPGSIALLIGQCGFGIAGAGVDAVKHCHHKGAPGTFAPFVGGLHNVKTRLECERLMLQFAKGSGHGKNLHGKVTS